MDDLGRPTSYLNLKKGAAVYSEDGEKVGHVTEVRADQQADIFDGIVLRKGVISRSGARHFVSADLVDEIFEKGVRLTIDAATVGGLEEHA